MSWPTSCRRLKSRWPRCSTPSATWISRALRSKSALTLNLTTASRMCCGARRSTDSDRIDSAGSVSPAARTRSSTGVGSRPRAAAAPSSRSVAFLISPAFSSSSSTATPLSVLVLPVPGQKAGKGCELILGELLAVKRLREHAHARLSRASALAARHEVPGQLHEPVIRHVQGFAKSDQDMRRGGLDLAALQLLQVRRGDLRLIGDRLQ